MLLDVGTDNQERLDDPLYIGWRNHRIRGPQYDEFVDAFVSAVKRRWRHVLLQWEDFAGSNAARLLTRYRDQLCTFNDDIQGTAAVATATLLSAVNVTRTPLKEQRIVFVGFGSAGIGIANLLVSVMQDEGLTEQQAREHLYALDLPGLLVEGEKGLRPEQEAFARKRGDVAQWQVVDRKKIGLLDIVRNAKPTVLIGVSGQSGVFTEEAVREMANNAQRPIIFPLSNPTSRAEATPQQLLEWTQGRALIGTGSPFEPVTVNGKQVPIDETNNSYIFPGLALGMISSRAKRVSDAMIKAAAKALAELSPTRNDKEGSLLPPLETLRSVSKDVAEAVGAQAIKDELAQVNEAEFEKELAGNIWEPEYRPYELAG
jgi:malate dehydrogenase (oxaloacetate-decarboxylating)